MRRFAIIAAGLVSVAAFATAASAADLPARTYTKAPPIAPVYNWGGFYVGFDGGGASSHNCWSGGIPVAVGEGCHDATGGLAGGQIGYRWQTTNWVFGLEAQGDWANLKGSNVSSVGAFGGVPFTNQTRIDSIGLFTGQVGYAWNNLLGYVKGGAAVTHDKYDLISNTTVVGLGGAPVIGPGNSFANTSQTQWGGVIGAGLEYGFAPNWSVALEYDHLFMGTQNVTFVLIPALGGATVPDRVRQDVDMGTIRLNYTFGGPVVARY